MPTSPRAAFRAQARGDASPGAGGARARAARPRRRGGDAPPRARHVTARGRAPHHALSVNVMSPSITCISTRIL